MSVYSGESVKATSGSLETSPDNSNSFFRSNIRIQRKSLTDTADYSFSFSLVLLVLFSALLLTFKTSVDENTFFIVNNFGRLFPAEILAVITDMGNGVVAGSFLFILMCFRPEWTVRVLVAALICTLVTHTLKSYFGSMRPPALFESINIVGKARHYHSFPSGHSATIFLFAGIYFLSSHKLLFKAAAVLLAVMVATSRIAVGAHWPVDVALGAIIGWLSAYYACVLIPASLSCSNKQIFGLFVIYVLLILGVNMGEGDLAEYPIVKLLEFSYLLLAGITFYMKFGKNKVSFI